MVCSLQYQVQGPGREREMVDGESSGAEALEKLAKHEAGECDTNYQNGDSQLNSF